MGLGIGLAIAATSYRARPGTVEGGGDPSGEAPTSAPTGVFVIAGAQSATVHWGAAPTGATNAVIERRTDGAYTQVATPAVAGGSYTDTGLTDGATYTYRVRWSNEHGSGPESPARVCVPWTERKALRGDPNFDAGDLSTESALWHGRLLSQISDPASLFEYGYNPNNLYALGRFTVRGVVGALVGLRVTGDLRFLDAADYGMQLARAELRDQGAGESGSDGYRNWVWLQSPSDATYYNRDNHRMDEQMTHGMVAVFAWACQQNRDLTSPGGVDYGERADFWLDYLRNDFEPKWRGRNNEPTDLPWIGPHGLTHADYRFALDFNWYYWRLTGDVRYRNYADYVYDQLRLDVVRISGTSNDVWPLGSNALVGRTRGVASDVFYELHSSTYTPYMALDGVNAYLEGNPKVQLEHLQGFANSVAAYVLDDGTNSVAAGIGGDGELGGYLDCTDGRRSGVQYYAHAMHYLAAFDTSGTITTSSIAFYNAHNGAENAISASLGLLTAYQLGELEPDPEPEPVDGYRYYRLLIAASEGAESDWVDVAELKLYGPTITGGVPTGGTASANDQYSGNHPTRAFDDDPDTYWESGDVEFPHWVQYDFGVATTLTGYGIRARNHSSAAARTAPTTWQFQGSDDGENWTTLDSQSDVTGWTASELKDFTL